MSGRKVANILFNDVLNTFYSRGILFPISSKGSFICHITAFVTPVLEHRIEREIAKWVYQYGVSNVRRNCSKLVYRLLMDCISVTEKEKCSYIAFDAWYIKVQLAAGNVSVRLPLS